MNVNVNELALNTEVGFEALGVSGGLEEVLGSTALASSIYEQPVMDVTNGAYGGGQRDNGAGYWRL